MCYLKYFESLEESISELYKNDNILCENIKKSLIYEKNLTELLIRHLKLTEKQCQKLEKLEETVKCLRERLGDFD